MSIETKGQKHAPVLIGYFFWTEDNILQPWNSKISVPFYQFACPCHHCVNQFYQSTSETGYGGEAASPNQKKELQHHVVTFSKQFPQLCPEYSRQPSVAISETEYLIPIDKGGQLVDEATRESANAYTSPILGLISLCNSIPAAYVSESSLKTENRSPCAEVHRSDSASTPQPAIPHQTTSEAHQAISSGAPNCNIARGTFRKPAVCKLET